MHNDRSKMRPDWIRLSLLIGMATLMVIILGLEDTSTDVSAHSSDTFGPACGAPVIDGEVNTSEWAGASQQTFLMSVPNSATPFTTTLYVMNSANYLYLGITINDDEMSTIGDYLPNGDAFRIDFDNDNSGELFGFQDDVLSVMAGLPQFEDGFIVTATLSSASSDLTGAGTSDGVGAANRVADLNHFEVKHPLCSGDDLDFCLHPVDVVGFRLEYLDAEANGSFGGSQYFPGYEVTSEADIVIGNCSIPDLFIYLPLIEQQPTLVR